MTAQIRVLNKAPAPLPGVRVGAVLMASGSAHRFGRGKLLETVDGMPMIQHTFQAVPPELFCRAAAVSACPRILALAEEQGYLPIPNPQAAEGISASVRLGLSALLDMDGVLFAVCDQPWLKRSSTQRLLEQFSAAPNLICALGWQGQRGNPVIFPSALFPELLDLTGDRGGGRVIQAHPGLLRLVDVEDPGQLRDVDTPEDLAEQDPV